MRLVTKVAQLTISFRQNTTILDNFNLQVFPRNRKKLFKKVNSQMQLANSVILVIIILPIDLTIAQIYLFANFSHKKLDSL